MYDDFPAGRLGYLQGIAFRACRLVVDTGLHAKRWSREQAVAFFVNEIGSKAEEVAQRSRPLLQLARPGLRLQGRPQRNQPPAGQGASGARPALRHQGVQRRRAHRRQRPDGRARQERRRICESCAGLRLTVQIFRQFRKPWSFLSVAPNGGSDSVLAPAQLGQECPDVQVTLKVPAASPSTGVVEATCPHS